MALADYNYGIEAGGVEVIENGDSFSVLIDGKILCSMSSGSAIRRASQREVEFVGRSYARGNTGGAYLSEDVDNFIA